jgi:Leucine-rich repeat (LRR) protein
MKWLMLYSNNILNISEIRKLLNLEQINIEENCITDFSPIDYLKEKGVLTTIKGASSDDQDYSRCK